MDKKIIDKAIEELTETIYSAWKDPDDAIAHIDWYLDGICEKYNITDEDDRDYIGEMAG